MNWTELTTSDQLEEIKKSKSPSVIFKHSTRCSVSNMALKMFQKEWNHETPVTVYYLDLLAFRSISNQLSADYSIPHESPQVLLIQNNTCIFDASHQSISAQELSETITENYK